MMRKREIVGQAFPPAVLNQWRPGMAILQYCYNRSPSQNRPLRPPRSRIILPDALAAEVGVAIVTKFDAWRQVLEQFRVATSEHDVINDKSAL